MKQNMRYSPDTTGEFLAGAGLLRLHPDENWHLYILQCVADAATFGLNEHYCPEGEPVKIDAFLFDLFGGDMPWNPLDCQKVEQKIRSHPEFEELRRKFQARFGVDWWGDDEMER